MNAGPVLRTPPAGDKGSAWRTPGTATRCNPCRARPKRIGPVGERGQVSL